MDSSKKTELFDTAYSVAEDYRNGKWPQSQLGNWKETWKFLIGELKRRYPGCTDDDYTTALNDGFFATR
jgi:hypothetical protein